MVNFTFVPHKGARPEKSELVKSHVMRESQRKRREAKLRRTHIVSETEHPVTVVRGAQSNSQSFPPVPINPISNPATVAEHDVGVLMPDGVFDNPEYSVPHLRSSLGPDSALCPDVVQELWNGPQSLVLSNAEIVSSIDTIPDDSFVDTDGFYYMPPGLEGLDYESNILAADTLTAETEPILTRQPPIIYPTFLSGSGPSDAGWLSPRLFDRVVELVSHFTSTLYIERSNLPPINPVIYWQDKALVDVKILLSCALFYSAYRDVVQGLPVDDHHYFKDRFLRLINMDLANPETAVSDSNLASVISMCMYENIRGTSNASVHLQGLLQMIDMRGGINNLPTDQGQHLSEMALLQDMIYACCSNVPPVMFDICAPILRDSGRSAIDHWYPQSPLRVVNDTGFLRPTLEPQSSFEILRDAFDGFEMLCIKEFDPETACEEAEVFKVRRAKFWGRLIQGNTQLTAELPPTNKARAERAIRVAAKIHYRAVVFNIQHEDEVNTEDATKLHGICRKIELGFWKVAHYVYLWVLLTGGAASSKHPPLRSYFVSEIMRLGLSIGLYDWHSFRQTVGNFLWLQHFLRKESLIPRAQEDMVG